MYTSFLNGIALQPDVSSSSSHKEVICDKVDVIQSGCGSYPRCALGPVQWELNEKWGADRKKVSTRQLVCLSPWRALSAPCHYM